MAVVGFHPLYRPAVEENETCTLSGDFIVGGGRMVKLWNFEFHSRLWRECPLVGVDFSTLFQSCLFYTTTYLANPILPSSTPLFSTPQASHPSFLPRLFPVHVLALHLGSS